MEGLKSVWIAVVALLILGYATKTFGANYGDALYKSILFYEAQRSGRLPSSQRVNWRADSGLYDGRQQGVDLVGGYYDAGDNVKFGLPMAFTITMLSWSALEYHTQLKSSGQLGYVLDAIKWGTDYFIKAHPEPNVLWGEVGDGYTDHTCWQRPEDMTTPRQAYKIDANSPGSDLAGETAAAMAAASIAFRKHNNRYSASLLNHAQQLFQFADTHRGKYDSSIQVAQKFYNSKSGYADELLWAAIWLFMATRNQYYLKYVADNAVALGGIGWNMKEFSWDVKYAGVQVLASKILMQGRGGQYTQTLQKYQYGAEYFLCACLQKNNGNNVQKTPGGLMYVRSWNNIQYVTSASFLLTVYSDYLTSAKQQLKCPSYRANPSELLSLAQQQINYILGDNPRATSYMVGYGAIFPQQVHHRASSIVSIKVNNQFVSCRGGYATWFSSRQRDPNILVGALVGGPDQNDNFADERDNYEQTEPATYNNGPLVGVLARLHVGPQRQDTPDSLTGTSFTSISQSPPAIHTGDLVEIKQNVTASWIQEESTYYRYAVTVTNKSKQSLTQLEISINDLYGNLWGLAKIGNTNTYTFPEWRNSLSPGESLTFVYIQAAEEAEVLVAKAE